MPNGELTKKQMQNIGSLFADPNFSIDHYANNMRDFMNLVEDAQETELRMEARQIEAISTMLVSGGGYSNPKDRK